VFALALVLALFCAASAAAQTLETFNIERTIALDDILTIITPNIPASTLAALAGGALEIRETMSYNPQANTLTSTIFAVPTGSPIPTPPAVLANLGTALIAAVTMTIDKIYVNDTPFMSVMFVGTDTQSTATPYGSYLGAVSNVSVGFTSATPPTINTVVETVAGVIALYSASATVNSFTVTAAPSGPGGSGSGSKSPTIVVKGGTTQTTLDKQIVLDASGSTDPNGLTLSFAWTAAGQNVALENATSSTGIATAQLGNNGPQTYTFMLTVTDSAGNSATATVTVTYQ
jgi:hypothetical protein